MNRFERPRGRRPNSRKYVLSIAISSGSKSTPPSQFSEQEERPRRVIIPTKRTRSSRPPSHFGSRKGKERARATECVFRRVEQSLPYAQILASTRRLSVPLSRKQHGRLVQEETQIFETPISICRVRPSA